MISFFLELAATQGRLLKIDDCTTNKDRLDYARFLISTPSLKEINVIEEVWIDGRMFPIRIIEDVEFGFAEDACLVEYEDDNDSQCSVPEGFQEDEPIVDALVQQLKDDWEAKTKEDQKDNSVTVNQISSTCQQELIQKEVKVISSQPIVQHVAESTEGAAKSNSCKVSNHSQHSKKRRKVVPSLIGLKRIARLSAEDRNVLIRSLKSSRKKRATLNASKSQSVKQKGVSLSAGSGPSTNSKDWKNWMSVHGDAKEVAADIVDVGKIIGVKCQNSFQVLSRGGVKGGKVESEGEKKLEVRKGGKK
jgi:hypothetical protein